MKKKKKEKEIEEAVKKRFSNNSNIFRDELYDFLNDNFYSDLKDSTFRWRLYDLIDSNILTSVNKGIYKLYEGKKNYKPAITDIQKKINKLIKRNFNELKYCIWNSIWFNDFSRHQAFQNIVFVEVERDFVRSIFNLFLDNSLPNVYIEPSKETVDTYLSEYNNTIVVKYLISKAPTTQESGIPTPHLEKMLVDLFCDKKYFLPYKGNEEKIIFKNAFDEFKIDLSRLINYSRRRKRDVKITNYLVHTINIEKELLS